MPRVLAADRMAVVRNFEVLGEAARHVDAATATRLADIPWQDMRDLRNLLIHEYFGVYSPTGRWRQRCFRSSLH